MSETKVISANVEKELVEWADARHAALGYSSRSKLINDAMREKKERDQGADQ